MNEYCLYSTVDIGINAVIDLCASCVLTVFNKDDDDDDDDDDDEERLAVDCYRIPRSWLFGSLVKRSTPPRKKILTYAKSRTTRICVLPPEEQKSLFPLVDQLLSFQNIQRLRFVHNLSNEGINDDDDDDDDDGGGGCLLYTSPSPRDRQKSRMPSSA